MKYLKFFIIMSIMLPTVGLAENLNECGKPDKYWLKSGISSDQFAEVERERTQRKINCLQEQVSFLSKFTIGGLEKEVLLALKNMDFSKLSHYAHPDSGVRFSPYSFVNLESDKVLMPSDIKRLGKKDKSIIWGHSDGSGEEIKLNLKEYISTFVYTEDFANLNPKYNYFSESSGNMAANKHLIYRDSISVSYFSPATEGKNDWAGLDLIFLPHDGKWYLAGVIHHQWTI